MVRNSGRESQYTTERALVAADTREIDGAVVVGVNLIDHILQFRLGRVLAQRSHHRSQLFGGDLS